MRLSVEQIIQYQTEGYLIAENVLTDSDLQPIIDEINQEIDRRAMKLYDEGKISELYENEPFETRFAFLHRQCPEIGRSFDIMNILGEAMFTFLKNDNLLDVVECLLGSEITCNPIQHMRAKLPLKQIVSNTPLSNFENVPWHQDSAVTSEDSEASEIITFWIPLVNATAETGCMEIMPEVFKVGYLKHQAEGGTTIVPQLLPHVQPVLAECQKGGVVIMNKYTPHRGTTNGSEIIRWSVDLRYHKTGAASGRSFHPSFVARSKSNPENVLHNHRTWCSMWNDALAAGQGRKIHRV